MKMERFEKLLLVIMKDENDEVYTVESGSFVELELCDDVKELEHVRDWCDARLKERHSNASS